MGHLRTRHWARSAGGHLRTQHGLPGALRHVNEVSYIPFEGEAANLFFQLVSARYERASVIVTSNKPFRRWGGSLRRPRRHRRHDRPARPPCRSRFPQKRQLPAQRPRPGESANRQHRVTKTRPGGSIFNPWKEVNFQAVLTIANA